MKKVNLSIPPDQHVFIAGRTGSGKTFLAKNYLAGYDNVIVLDTKGTFTWEQVEDAPIFTKLSDLMEFGEGKAIYRPCFEELSKEYYEKFFEWIYLRKNTIVNIDEIMSISQNSFDIPLYAKAILTRGRERNTALWGCTQRPKTIPLVYMSEASHFFVFDLNLDTDRKRIMEVCESDLFLEKPNKFKFWYYNFEMDEPIKASLVVRD